MKLHPRTEKLLRRVGEDIRTWRVSQRLTATAVADRAGITRVTLRQIEKDPAAVTKMVLKLSGELAEHLEKIQPGIKVLFISGYTNDVVLEHGILEDKVEFIQKPFSPTELASRVKWMLVE